MIPRQRTRKPRKYVPWPTHEDRRDALQRRLVHLDKELHHEDYRAVKGVIEEIEMIAEIGKSRGDTGWHVHRPPRHAWEGGALEVWNCCPGRPREWPPCCSDLDPHGRARRTRVPS